jgi:hypothetical protein
LSMGADRDGAKPGDEVQDKPDSEEGKHPSIAQRPLHRHRRQERGRVRIGSAAK